MKNQRWIASARFDLGLIVGPPLAAVLLVLCVPALRSDAMPPWGWFLFVVGIDVAHVYASLYRTYLDPDEFARRRNHYILVPAACWLGGILLYGIDAILFWRVLAYVAVFHFVRQQYGFVMVYRHRFGEVGALDRRIDKAAIYATMLYPLAFWHANPDREFAWFVPGDFLALPGWIDTAAVWLYSAIVGVFALRQVQHAVRGRPLNWGKIGVVASTAAVWYVGIVLLDSDFAFTVTNVVAHGVPYMALVWLYGNRKWSRSGSWRRLVHRPAAVGLFVGSLLALAYLEEGLWDWMVWHEHAGIFGGIPALDAPKALLILVVPLLTVPQATHYILDAWIWKFDGSNPDLRENLFPRG